MNLRLFLGGMVLSVFGLTASAEDASVKSPDGRLKVTVSCTTTDSTASYRISYDGKDVILPSGLGFDSNAGDFTRGLTMMSHNESRVSEHYKLLGCSV